MKRTAVTKPSKLEPDERQIDLEDYLDIPAFLLAENRPPDLQARTDARIRAYQEKKATEKAGEVRRSVPRYRRSDT